MPTLDVDLHSMELAGDVVAYAASDCDPHRSMVEVDAGDDRLTAALRAFGADGVTVGRRLRDASTGVSDGLRGAVRVYQAAHEALARAAAG